MQNHEVESIRRKVEGMNYKLSKKAIKDDIDVIVGVFLENYPKRLLIGGEGVQFLDGNPFLVSYNRVVIGAHGPYIEFEKHHLLTDIYIPVLEQYRLDGKYNVKYHVYQPVNRVEKIYYQTRTVDYADYVPEKYYIDFYLTSLCRINKQ